MEILRLTHFSSSGEEVLEVLVHYGAGSSKPYVA